MFLIELVREYFLLNTDVRSNETKRLIKLSARNFDVYLQAEHGRQVPEVQPTGLKVGESVIAQVEDLCDRHLAGYVHYRRSLGRADTTVEREVAKLHTLANWAALHGFLEKAPLIRPFKANIDPPVGFSSDELRRLFKTAMRYDAPCHDVPGRIWMRALVYTFWDTLERSGAVWSTDRIDIDVAGKWWWPRRGWITLRERKGNAPVLRRRLRYRTTRYVRALLAAHGHEKAFSIGRTRHTLYYHWARLLKQAGIKDDRWHGPHCLRKTGGSLYQRSGGRASEVLDHADEATTIKHYLVPEIIGAPQPIDRLQDPIGLFGRAIGLFGRVRAAIGI